MDTATSASGQRGDQSIRKAEEKLKDPKGFDSFIAMFAAPNYRKEEALQHYMDAAKHFKAGKEWKKAGETYLKIAAIFTELKEDDSKIAGMYDQASHCLIKEPSCVTLAKSSMESSCGLWSAAGDWMNAVKAQTGLCEFLEQQGADKAELADCWEKVADLNDMDSSVASQSAALKKAAAFLCAVERWEKAAKVYESIGEADWKHPLLKFNVKEVWKNGLICRMALGDLIYVKKTNDAYAQKAEDEYAMTREYKFIKNLVMHAEAGEPEKFEAEVAFWHKFTPLPDWQMKILGSFHDKLEKVDDEPDFS